jgi:hypothetical protein
MTFPEPLPLNLSPAQLTDQDWGHPTSAKNELSRARMELHRRPLEEWSDANFCTGLRWPEPAAGCLVPFVLDRLMRSEELTCIESLSLLCGILVYEERQWADVEVNRLRSLYERARFEFGDYNDDLYLVRQENRLLSAMIQFERRLNG